MKKISYSLQLLVLVVSFIQAYAQPSKKQRIECFTQEPLGFVRFDTSNPRGLADNYYLWDNGKTIYVKIMNANSSKHAAAIRKYCHEWEKYANLKFVLVENGDAHIRIVLTGDDGEGCYTRGLGIQLLEYPQSDFNMHLDTTAFIDEQNTYRKIVHEFGHAIGLMHEHMNPTSGIKWDKNAVYARYKMQGWSKEMVDAQLFVRYSYTYTNGTKYDSKSIMHYPISMWETTDRYYVDWNYSISDGDKELVAALYPKASTRKNEFPRFAVTNFAKMDVEKSDKKQGISFFPSFTITTAGKEGRVAYLTVFFDENGNPVATNSKTFSFEGFAATNKSTVLLPGKKIEVNKSKHDMELFIPYAEIPETIRGKKVTARFFIFLLDNNETKRLYSSESIQCDLRR
jgi:hypothetical protein